VTGPSWREYGYVPGVAVGRNSGVGLAAVRDVEIGLESPEGVSGGGVGDHFWERTDGVMGHDCALL
jgi:hypothetical protein